MRLKILSILAAILAPVVFSASALAYGPYKPGTVGVDVSWPNCNDKQPSGVNYGIVGVTGGKNFSQNNCLAKQASWFKNLSLYLNTGYPGLTYALQYQNTPKQCNIGDQNCLAYNYGYNAAVYGLNYAKSQKVSSDTWWLDVETSNTWMSDSNQNVQSLSGTIDALKDAGIKNQGIYSTTYQWTFITLGWQNNLPGWGATTWRTAKQAATYCSGHEFTGGPSWLMQYNGKLDQDYAC